MLAGCVVPLVVAMYAEAKHEKVSFSAHLRPRRTRGFTLVEIMVVVVIIGLLATMAMPAMRRVHRKARNTAFVNDLRIFIGAFETAALEDGQWPADSTSRNLPAAMNGRIKIELWRRDTPVGGAWDYDANVYGVLAGISVLDPIADRAQMTEIDKMIDDGDLTTGSFRSNGTRYIWALEADPASRI